MTRNAWRLQVYGRYMWMLRRWRDECCCARTALIERWLFDTGAALDCPVATTVTSAASHQRLL
ncbi:hypothetical protein J2W56_006336 [Nocardia kruczakiae]|uniref:Uncharacterized protein n=1 Tax=Nocardia kruczakiae TaxID=261477 RepID=A0ABU1XRC2_9NOCA|nr:hypothetical protein [Nocardia kruczakiae]MDR7172571.1 hypothetical protein [Nocardia kruczakiae]